MTVPEEVLQREPYGPDLVEVIREDHSQASDALAHLLEVRDAGERRELFRAVVRQLSVHEAAEEEVVYPHLGGLGPEAVEVRSRRLEEERQAKRLLARMLRQELLNPAGLRFRRNLERLHSLVRAHAAAEEAEVLPLLTGAEGDTKLRLLATLFDQAKATAPTRPHPHGPDRLGGLVVTAPVLAVVDRVRDYGRRLITG
jgi:hemerythrin superfamily protein